MSSIDAGPVVLACRCLLRPGVVVVVAGPQFRWSDGVFLKALRAGDWVLLDELNLASQSVLEGLNACLDHRGTVYIPEIDKYVQMRRPRFVSCPRLGGRLSILALHCFTLQIFRLPNVVPGVWCAKPAESRRRTQGTAQVVLESVYEGAAGLAGTHA
jgi:hypothetical protein